MANLFGQSIVSPHLVQNICHTCKIQNKVETQCGEHYFCFNHTKENYCMACKCQNCLKFGTELLKCSHKFCAKCKPCRKCCEFCGGQEKVRVEPCGHPSCATCKAFNSLCPCITCEVCSKSRPVKRNCPHLTCQNCEIQGFCPLCKSGQCDTCNQAAYLFQISCNHFQCNSCITSGKQCTSCKVLQKCTYCYEMFSSDMQTCMFHPICEYCQKVFKDIQCVYCTHTEDTYLCNFCQKIHRFISKLPCKHQTCDKCSNCFGVEHCQICHPLYFCKSCRKFEENYQENLCRHGFCKNCFDQKLCLECLCQNCKTNLANVIFPCGHNLCSQCNPGKLCQKCICPVCQKRNASKKIKKCGHEVCENCFFYQKCLVCNPNIYCKNCERNETPTVCEHKVCEKCRKLGRCEECKCYGCKSTKMLEKKKCGHTVCNPCSFANSCKKCYSKPCVFCGKPNTDKRLQDCGHTMCSLCFNEKFCIGCRPDLTCQKCKKYRDEVYCLHHFCYMCRVAENCGCSCILCKKTVLKMAKTTCGHLICVKCIKLGCNSCKSKKCDYCGEAGLEKQKKDCGHYLCKNCFHEAECYACDPSSFCRQCKNKNGPFCRAHGNCLNCILSGDVFDCLCLKCMRINDSKTCQVGHTCCECIRENTCFDCYNKVCNKCGDNKNAKWSNGCLHIFCKSCFTEENCVLCNIQPFCIIDYHPTESDYSLSLTEVERNKFISELCEKNEIINNLEGNVPNVKAGIIEQVKLEISQKFDQDCSVLRNEIKEKLQKIKELERINEEKEKENIIKQKEIELIKKKTKEKEKAVHDKFKAIQSQNQYFERQIKDLKSENEEFKGQIQILRCEGANNKKFEEDRKRTSEEIEKWIGINGKIEKEKSEIEEERNQTVKKLQEKIKELELKLNKAQKDLEGEIYEMSLITEENVRCISLNEELQVSLKNEKEKNEMMKIEYLRNETKFNQIKSEVIVSQSEHNENSINTLKERVKSLEIILEKSKSIEEEHTLGFTELHNKNLYLIKQNEKLEESLKEKSSELVSSTDSIQVLKQKSANYKVTIKILQGDIKLLSQNLSNLTENFQINFMEKLGELNEKKKKISSLKKEISILKQNFKDKEFELENTQRMISISNNNNLKQTQYLYEKDLEIQKLQENLVLQSLKITKLKEKIQKLKPKINLIVV